MNNITEINTAIQDTFGFLSTFEASPKSVFNKEGRLSTKSSDYKLFISGHRDMILKKYEPLIKATASDYYRNRSKDAAIDYMDLYQDNMIYAMRAIEYVDLKRIDSNFRFGSILIDYLTGYNNSVHLKSDTQTVYKQKSLDFEYANDEGDSVTLYDTGFKNQPVKNVEVNSSYSRGADVQFEEMEFRKDFEEFRKTLTPLEQNILELTEKGMMLKEISVMVGHKTSANTAYFKIKMKNKYKEFMRAKGYEIQ